MYLIRLLDFNRNYPYSKVHEANMGPIWDRQDPGGPHVGPMTFAIWVDTNGLANWTIKHSGRLNLSEEVKSIWSLQLRSITVSF